MAAQASMSQGLVFASLLLCLSHLPSVMSQDCPVGTFGPPTCSGQCHCLDNALCDHVSGHCEGKCAKGYYKPPVCQEECPNGLFGIDCELICHCLANATCDKKSGYCPNNQCHPDWYSAACSKRLPKLVSPPVVSVATCSQLTVTWPLWNADTDFGDLELPVAQYRLYTSLKNASTEVWQHERTFNVSDNATATHFVYNVSGLQPDQFYVFRVDLHGSNDGKVVEKHSKGFVSDPPTRVPCTTTTAPPPVTRPVIVGSEIFSVLRAVADGSDALVVTWSIDADLQRFQWIIALTYRKVGIGDCSPLDDGLVTTMPLSQSDTQRRLGQLGSWNVYEVTMTAQGMGIIVGVNGSEVITATTGEVPPTGSVTQLQATDVQSDSATLAWGEVPCVQRGGTLLHYEIVISQLSDDGAAATKVETIRNNLTTVTVAPLTPFTNYTARVRYVNSAGPGPQGVLLPFTTEEGVPSAVRITELVPSATTLVVHINGPEHANGRLVRLDVVHSTVSSFTPSTSLLVNYPLTADPVIKRLTPNTVYFVKVRAETGAGFGPYGGAVNISTLTVRPFPPSSLVQSAVNSSCVSISWLPPDQSAVTVTGYKVTITQDNSDVTPPGGITINTTTLPPNTTHYTTCMLQPGSVYSVSVVSLSIGGSGDPATIMVMTEQETPPTPSAPELVAFTPTSASVQIRPVSVRSGPLIFYQLEVERIRVSSLMSTDGGGGGNDVTNSSSSSSSSGAKRRRKRLAEVPGYVTAQLNQTEVLQTTNFTIGDGRNYGGFINAPLQPGHTYRVYYVLVSQWNGQTKFSLARLPSPFTTPLPTTTTPTTTTVTTTTSNATTAEPPSPEDDNGAFIGVILALIVVVLLIIALIVFFLWWRRRKATTSRDYVELDEEKKPLPSQVYDPESYWSRATMLGEPRHIVVGRECVPDEQLIPAGPDRPPPGAVLVSFQKEFQSLPHQGEHTTTQEALLHLDRNRFPHILPYDHSLVQLAPDQSSDCTYVNANFMSGYRAARAYIAAQSPYDDVTAVDFWRLIYQQGVTTVVMLTNVMEDNIVKCTQFWPREGKVTIGQFFLELREESVYADFTLYDISLKQSSEGREASVRLFDFTAWPEHGVPRDPSPFLDLRRKVQQYQGDNSSPILVHCGTGVSRSGVFIAVDSLIDQYAEEGRISVFSFISKMRSERPLMVRTLKQYVFIYECLLEYFQAGQVMVNEDLMKDMFHRWTEHNTKTGNSFLKDQFHLLQRLTRPLDEKQCSAAFLPENIQKNRYPHIMPSDLHRPELMSLQGSPHFTGDYINAIYVDGYRTQKQFIITQTPQQNTLADFYSLVYQQRVSTLVTMDNYNGQGTTTCVHYWEPDNTARPWGPFWVNIVSAFQQENVTVRDIKLVSALNSEEAPHVVRQFQFNGWAEKSLTPVSKTMALDLIQMVTDHHRSSLHPHSPIVVHCEDGATHSGLLVSLAVVCERMQEDGEVDVYHTVKRVKTRRPHVMHDYDQYRYCYKALWDFLNLRMEGGRFTESLGQTRSDAVYGVASMNLTSNHDNLY